MPTCRRLNVHYSIVIIGKNCSDTRFIKKMVLVHYKVRLYLYNVSLYVCLSRYLSLYVSLSQHLSPAMMFRSLEMPIPTRHCKKKIFLLQFIEELMFSVTLNWHWNMLFFLVNLPLVNHNFFFNSASLKGHKCTRVSRVFSARPFTANHWENCMLNWGSLEISGNFYIWTV